MSSLRGSLADYLSIRRGFGYKLTGVGQQLVGFITFCEAQGADVVTVELGLVWATQPTNVGDAWRAHRLSAVRGFARYLHALDTRTTIPPMGLLPSGGQRATPYLYSSEQVSSLMSVARTLPNELRAVTTATIIGLLFASGLRIGEALGIDRDDVDLLHGCLSIRHPKFDRPREIPLHQSCVTALVAYAKCRDQLMPRPMGPAFFLTSAGARVPYHIFRVDFRGLLDKAHLEARPSCRPRVHGLRHSFAVNVLTRWYGEEADVPALLPSLSTYMGHVNPASTYWYLSGSPELLEQAVRRLEATYEVGP